MHLWFCPSGLVHSHLCTKLGHCRMQRESCFAPHFSPSRWVHLHGWCGPEQLKLESCLAARLSLWSGLCSPCSSGGPRWYQTCYSLVLYFLKYLTLIFHEYPYGYSTRNRLKFLNLMSIKNTIYNLHICLI